MNRMYQQAISALVAVAFSAGAALADTRHVPVQYSTIQAAIDAAVNGDTVMVADGTYTGVGNRDLDFGGRAITVQSANGAAACVIDIQGSAGDPHRAFHFHSGETAASIVQGFTITNGVMDAGGAMLIENGSAPTIMGCSFDGNTANPTVQFTGGGAVALYGSPPTWADCAFAGNHVNAISFTGGGAMVIDSGDVLITGCNFSGNSLAGTGAGGAIVTLGGGLTIVGSAFTENTSTVVAGAISSIAGAQMELTGCVFEDNTAALGGGGVFLQDSGTHTTIDDCRFMGNRSGQNWGGGGLRVGSGPTVEVFNCEFVNNVASPGIGGGAHVFSGAQVTFTDTVFTGNQSDGGGALSSLNSGVPVVAVNCRFVDNTAFGNGGAVWLGQTGFPGLGSFTNCLFEGNQAVANGGAIHVGGDSSAQIDNCTLARNVAAGAGGGLLLGAAANNVTVSSSILWDNAPQQIVQFGGLLSVTYSDIQGSWPGIGNINEDPVFLNPLGGDLRLGPGSQCIDKGHPAFVPPPCADLDGRLRVWDGDGNGSRFVDMGAYEFGSPPMGDLNCDGAVNALDIHALILALLDPAGYAESYPACDIALADVDCSGVADPADIGPLVQLLLGP